MNWFGSNEHIAIGAVALVIWVLLAAHRWATTPHHVSHRKLRAVARTGSAVVVATRVEPKPAPTRFDTAGAGPEHQTAAELPTTHREASSPPEGGGGLARTPVSAGDPRYPALTGSKHRAA